MILFGLICLSVLAVDARDLAASSGAAYGSKTATTSGPEMFTRTLNETRKLLNFIFHITKYQSSIPKKY